MPALTITIRAVKSPAGRVMCRLCCVSTSPSWPYSPQPLARTRPASVTTNVENVPQDTAMLKECALSGSTRTLVASAFPTQPAC